MWGKVGIYIFFLMSAASVVTFRWISQVRSSLTRRDQHRPLDKNSWDYVHKHVPLRFFGTGCKQDFKVYFDRASSVQVGGLDEVLAWLFSCTYVPDQLMRGVPDHWQHPVDFELSKAGDCEDHALWAWRKLVELGYKAEFVAGKRIREGVDISHAWVIWRHEGQLYLFETTAKHKDRAIKIQREAMTEYVPFVAVDENLKRKVYMGFPNWILLPASRRKAVHLKS